MDRGQFINALRRALYGKLDGHTLDGHIQYYEDYIAQELAKGRSEEEILAELGDPRLLARTILETSGWKPTYGEAVIVEEEGRTGDGGIPMHRYQGWKAALFLAFFLLAAILLLALVFHIFIALLPLLIIIGAVSWLVRKIWE